MLRRKAVKPVSKLPYLFFDVHTCAKCPPTLSELYTMTNFEKIQSAFGDLPYMYEQQARIMRDLITRNDASELLEIGFFQGKSSAYFAAILEDLGRGHLVTIDLRSAMEREPNIEKVLSTVGLSHRVTPIYAHRSYTWELAKMIQSDPTPRFDFCYFDGGHTWDNTGFGFLLVDVLLRPGGLIVFDDLPWTIEEAMKGRLQAPRHWRSCSPDERATPCVKLVYDRLVPHLGYTDTRVTNDGRWGIARKPAIERPVGDVRSGLVERFRRAVAGR